MRLLLATGGTGGHIYPAMALAEAAKKRYQDIEILLVGNDDRMEATLIPEAGYAFHALHTSGLTGGILHKLKAVEQMLKAKHQAIKLMKQWKPDIVVGFGGYVSAPVILAAHRLHIPTLIHEQNSVAGASNKLAARSADGIVICYERLFETFPKHKTRLLGNPRATSALQVSFQEEYFKELGLNKAQPLILVVMGSLGSTSINEIMCEALPQVNQNYQILFVTGKNNKETVMKQLPKQANLHVVDYVRQLEIMEQVDLIICRAGATTAAEITALGVPAIIVPSPYVAHNHQFYNANVLKERKAAFMIEEKELTKEKLISQIDVIMKNSALQNEMRQAMRCLGFPNASEDILDWIDEMKR